jgi:hypothetical protein
VLDVWLARLRTKADSDTRGGHAVVHYPERVTRGPTPCEGFPYFDCRHFWNVSHRRKVQTSRVSRQCPADGRVLLFDVLASILSLMLAIAFGFQLTVLVGAGFYVVAWAILYFAVRSQAPARVDVEVALGPADRQKAACYV